MKKKLKKLQKIKNILQKLSAKQKNDILKDFASNILTHEKSILQANKKDLIFANENNLSDALKDRLMLNEKRIKDISNAILDISNLPEPIGKVLETKITKNNLKIQKTTIPLGTICIIYESRPNVTSDVAALCFKSANLCLLKGGKEAINTNLAILQSFHEVLQKHNLPIEIFTFIHTKDKKELIWLLKQDKYIDLVIPRGGEGLIKFVSKYSKIPVLKHDKGVCHIFVDESANLKDAKLIILNAKCQKPSACNAVESVLIHEKIANKFLPNLKELLDINEVKIYGCEKTCEIIQVNLAKEDDFYKEYLDFSLNIKVIKDIKKAISHIKKHSSFHSEAILTNNHENAEKFLDEINSSCVYLNASTRFTDGGAFEKGAEIGISTNKLHARGPVGVEELCTYKYKIYGKGQIRK